MASRFKILMASGSKKGTQIYLHFLSKVPANEPPPLQIPQKGPCEEREREPFTGHVAYLSKKNSPFKFPSKGALPQGPLHGIPHREMPHHYSPIYTSINVPGIRAPAPSPHTRYPSA